MCPNGSGESSNRCVLEVSVTNKAEALEFFNCGKTETPSCLLIVILLFV